MMLRIVLFLALTSPTWACDCVSNDPSVKQMWKGSALVFAGTVESVAVSPNGDFRVQSVRIHVDEAFKGISVDQFVELPVRTTDCDYIFTQDERFVFFLQTGSTPGSWKLPGGCIRSLGSTDPASDDMLFLRALPKSAEHTRLSGTLYLGTAGRASDVNVRVTGPGGLTREVVTNSAGVYEFYDLREGSYTVHLDIPEDLALRWSSVSDGFNAPGRNDAVVKLGPGQGAAVDFVLEEVTP